MKNWVWVYKMQITPWNGEKVAAILKQVEWLNMPGNQEYRVAIDGDTIVWYEVWDSKEAHRASMQIPEVMELVSQAFPMLTGKPEMVFEGESI